MALNPVQIKDVQTLLGKAYSEISFDGKKSLVVYVDNADRTYRKGELKKIQKMFQHYNATYTEPTSGGKTGAVKMAPLEITVKASIKANPVATGKAKFKPSDIKPSIVNDWLDAYDIVDNVKKYIKSVDLEATVEKEILYLLDETAKDTRTKIPFDIPKDLIPAEFYEVLTSVKLAILLKKNDADIRKILGIPKDMDLKRSKVKIYIPQKANFPLIDYYISITATEKKSEESALRISVKSKVKSPKANTVKFKDVFSNKKDITDWYNSLNSQLKQKQKGPKIVAESALDVYNSYTGKAVFGIPIMSVLNLIRDDRTNITRIINDTLNNVITVHEFENILKTIEKNISKVGNNTEMSTFDGDIGVASSKVIQSSMSKVGGTPVKNTVYNMAYLCEKILVSASKQTSSTKHNYYQMFYDQVLTQKSIAYAVSSVTGKTLNYNFYSLVNFEQEYASWLALRSKNSPNAPNDVIGIDV
jgi:hypothetical protein